MPELRRTSLPSLTPWQVFRERWKGGCGSILCRQEGVRVVLARGDVPCDILFVAEAPGVGENNLGQPLVGPAGHLLDHEGNPPGIVQRAGLGGGKYRLAFTNLVGCIPLDETGDKSDEPGAAEIVCCSARLREFVALCRPRMIVCVGSLADKWLRGRKPLVPEYNGLYASIRHPAFILRSQPVAQPLEIKRCVVTLRDAVEAMENPGTGPMPDDDIPF